MNTCKNCKWYKSGEDMGECHRYARMNISTIRMGVTVHTIEWPDTGLDDYCGEFSNTGEGK